MRKKRNNPQRKSSLRQNKHELVEKRVKDNVSKKAVQLAETAENKPTSSLQMQKRRKNL